jgi:hypothetical protein
MMILATPIQVQMRYFAPREEYLHDRKSASNVGWSAIYRMEDIGLNSNMGEADG